MYRRHRGGSAGHFFLCRLLAGGLPGLARLHRLHWLWRWALLCFHGGNGLRRLCGGDVQPKHGRSEVLDDVHPLRVGLFLIGRRLRLLAVLSGAVRIWSRNK